MRSSIAPFLSKCESDKPSITSKLYSARVDKNKPAATTYNK